MRFSQRHGLSPVRSELQSDDLDQSTRNKIWNMIQLTVFDNIDTSYDPIYDHSSMYQPLFTRMWHSFFQKAITTSNLSPQDMARSIEEIKIWYFQKAQWHDIYDFIEHLAKEADLVPQESFTGYINKVLEEDKCAFRLIDGRIAEITNPTEIEALLEASDSSQDQFTPARRHISTAIDLCFDRKSPDYRNSVKESISAIEAAAVIITGDKKATLGQALKHLSKTETLHQALATGFSAIYGYTNDAKGIRHALLDEEHVAFDEAKYMAVSCSAFLNYLIHLASIK